MQIRSHLPKSHIRTASTANLTDFNEKDFTPNREIPLIESGLMNESGLPTS